MPRPLRVGVDARHLGGGRGVARYTSQLLANLAREYPKDRWLLLAGAADDELGALPNVSVKRHPVPGRVLFGAAALTGWPRLDALVGEPIDVIWLPAVAPVALSRATPYVLTVHDTSFEHRPQDFTAYERVWHRLARPRSLARRARLVIVPAPHVRDELVSGWGDRGVSGARRRRGRVCVFGLAARRRPGLRVGSRPLSARGRRDRAPQGPAAARSRICPRA